MTVSKDTCYGCWFKFKNRCDCNDCLDCGGYMGVPVDMDDDGHPIYQHVCDERRL